jgi:NAD+ synthase
MTTDDTPTPFRTAPERLEDSRKRIGSFLRDRVIESGHEGLVVWLDDALEPAVIAVLAADALGPERVRGVRPVRDGSSETVGGRLLASGLGIECREVPIEPLLDRFEDAVAPVIHPDNGAPAAGRARERLRMTALYYAADTGGRLVAGTLNRTRWLLGTATKGGTAVGDLLPLGHRYETEVRALADHLDLPDGLFETISVPVPGYEPGEGQSPEVIDPILYRLIDEDKGLSRTATETGADRDLVRACARRHAATAHKRAPPPTPADDDRHEFFHEIELEF